MSHIRRSELSNLIGQMVWVNFLYQQIRQKCSFKSHLPLISMVTTYIESDGCASTLGIRYHIASHWVSGFKHICVFFSDC